MAGFALPAEGSARDDSNFATRMKGSGVWAELIHQRFHKACDRLGLNKDRVELDTSLFTPSLITGQSSLF